MISRIAGLMVATAALLGVVTAPAQAAVDPGCVPALNRPCAWHQVVSGGVAGSARIYAPTEDQLTVLRVDVRIERSWGAPWETVASAVRVQQGSFQLSTPAIATTGYLSMVCATGGPVGDVDLQGTFCTSPH
ncbi:hypothetical protein GCM10009665_42300 [Kitasatospora nipponensis]|uniref:Secreted protein n=1 Tax=Kitasatospora nipponensis TaxID=258049 RepID=A0ABN1WJZ8_9ACTN